MIYIHKGQEEAFEEYESIMLEQLSKYNGDLQLRIKPTEDTVIDGVGEIPDEIHYLTFASEEDFQNYLADEERKKYAHLRDQAIRSTVLMKTQIF